MTLFYGTMAVNDTEEARPWPRDRSARFQRVEQCLLTDMRKQIWRPFMRAVRDYRLLSPGDRIAVCVSGGKDSMLLAVLMRLLQRHSEVPFEAVYLIMDPGYSPENRRRVEENARRLEIPYTLFESDVFEVAYAQDEHPCFLCARMRRGCLYKKARELGCNKIALGHHFDDVIETTLMAMLYGGQIQAMPPMLMARNFPGMALIRPLYRVREADIIAWRDAFGLEFLRCACRLSESAAVDEAALQAPGGQAPDRRPGRRPTPRWSRTSSTASTASSWTRWWAGSTGGESTWFLETIDKF